MTYRVAEASKLAKTNNDELRGFNVNIQIQGKK